MSNLGIDIELEDLRAGRRAAHELHLARTDVEGLGDGTAYRLRRGAVHGTRGHRHNEDFLGAVPAAHTRSRRSWAHSHGHSHGFHDGRLGSMDPVSLEEFEELVGDALDSVPDELMRLLDNVAFFVEDEPPADDPDLLGVYEGTPLTERDAGWASGSLPDRIVLYQGPLQRMCTDREDLREEIAVTVVHEIAHHFGIDDAALHDLGWG
jgi:predicted Zn-dependent protease with MMP-like domain